MKPDFFKELAKKTEKEPAKNIDHLILTQAKHHMPKPTKSYRSWIISSVSVAATLVIWFQYNAHQIERELVNESHELIAHHEEIELWVEASEWSEEDWNYLERGES